MFDFNSGINVTVRKRSSGKAINQIGTTPKNNYAKPNGRMPAYFKFESWHSKNGKTGYFKYSYNKKNTK